MLLQKSLANRLLNQTEQQVSIAPLIILRILMGGLLLFATIWSIYKSDIAIRYLKPAFYFKYYGFHWVPEASETVLWGLYTLLFLAGAGILLGLFYRFFIWVAFFIFTYLQLIDSTNYINHYYLLSILLLYMGCLPANKAFALDNLFRKHTPLTHIPYWMLRIFQLQLAIVYTYAGLAKLNTDWMINAMPLKIWLLQKQDFPVLGSLFKYETTHFLFSWFGAFYDLTIAFWLWWTPSRKYAYLAVLGFHILTGCLFNIGLFPPIMILFTLAFFSPEAHQKVLHTFYKTPQILHSYKKRSYYPFLKTAIGIFLGIQILLPLRHYFLYRGNILWTEEGYRFSWRVMLVEKEGTATFTIKDQSTNRFWIVDNAQFLTPYQEKRMSIQPDHILQYGQYLGKFHKEKYNIIAPIVTVQAHVSLNGRRSRLLIDPNINLMDKQRSIFEKDWINK